MVLAGLINLEQPEALLNEYLDELSFLAETAGKVPVKRFVQRLSKPDSRTFIGSGKAQELKEYIQQNKISGVIFDDEISPSQQRNLEKILSDKEGMQPKVTDRTGLILEIFAQRAKTSYAKTQVELAQLEYLYPRLVGMWTHLERQRGGTGTRGGAGEKEIETDRRIVRKKISALKEKLVNIDRQMATQRRGRGEMIRVALVGYTNVGKSTLMNLLAKSEVFAENKLFATLDTTVRKVVIDRVPFLLSDTVGFIRKLPHQLVESFKSTLDEVREADLLLHVVDLSHPGFEDQISEVKKTLMDIGAAEKPVITIFNKIDRVLGGSVPNPLEKDDLPMPDDEKPPLTLDHLKTSWLADRFSPAVFISAWNKMNLTDLKDLLYQRVKEMHLERYPNKLPF